MADQRNERAPFFAKFKSFTFKTVKHLVPFESWRISINSSLVWGVLKTQQLVTDKTNYSNFLQTDTYGNKLQLPAEGLKQVWLDVPTDSKELTARTMPYSKYVSNDDLPPDLPSSKELVDLIFKIPRDESGQQATRKVHPSANALIHWWANTFVHTFFNSWFDEKHIPSLRNVTAGRCGRWATPYLGPTKECEQFYMNLEPGKEGEMRLGPEGQPLRIKDIKDLSAVPAELIPFRPKPPRETMPVDQDPNATTDAIYQESILSGIPFANLSPGHLVMLTLYQRNHNRLAALVREKARKKNLNWSQEKIWNMTKTLNIVNILKIVVEDYVSAIAGESTWLPSEIRDASDKVIQVPFEYVFAYSWHASIPDKLAGDGGRSQTHYMNRPDLIRQKTLSEWIEIGIHTPACLQCANNTIDEVLPVERKWIEVGRGAKLAPFNKFRAALGFNPYSSFEELCGPGQEELASRLNVLYKGRIEALDLWVGMVCERQSAKIPDFFPQVTQALLAQIALNTVPPEVASMKEWVRSQSMGSLLKDKAMLNLPDFIRVNLPPGETGVNGDIFMRFPSQYLSSLFPPKKYQPAPPAAAQQAPGPTKASQVAPEPSKAQTKAAEL